MAQFNIHAGQIARPINVFETRRQLIICEWNAIENLATAGGLDIHGELDQTLCDLVTYLGVILCHSLARLGHSSVELVVRLAHQHCQLPELGQQGIVVPCEIINLVTPVLQLCPEYGTLLLGVLQTMLQVLYLHATMALERPLECRSPLHTLLL